MTEGDERSPRDEQSGAPPSGGPSGPPSRDVDAPAASPTLTELLSTPQGSGLAKQALALLEGLRQSTVDARAAERALQLEMRKMELQHQQETQKQHGELTRLQVSRGWWFQTLGLVGVVGGIIGLSFFEKLDPAAGTILGAVAGYLFGQKRSSRIAEP